MPPGPPLPPRRPRRRPSLENKGRYSPLIFSANSSNKDFHREGAKTAKGKVLVFCSEKNEGDSIKNLSAFGKKIAFFAVFAPSRLSFLGSFVFALAF
ncbi:MAG TPA: hypothetical protein VJ873_05110, partial [bacterium]|nr:hypothetical protein [bacterium]